MLDRTHFRLLSTTCCLFLCFSASAFANEKIEQAMHNYQKRVAAEKAKLLAVIEKEQKISVRKKDVRQQKWIADFKQNWMNRELIVSGRGAIESFSNSEAFGAKDFQLAKFQRQNNRLFSNDGIATVRIDKRHNSAYFKAIVESKNNFAFLLNQSTANLEKDLAIIIGGWNNKKSEIHFNGQSIATKPVGMPPRWLCEISYENQIVRVFANGVELMNAKTPRPIQFDLASISVSHDAATIVHSPILKVK